MWSERKRTEHGLGLCGLVERAQEGLEVARLAGLPQAVVERAREVLHVHERTESQQLREAVPAKERVPSMQMTMFTPLSQRIVDRIEQVDVNALTPLQALNLLEELQQELKKNGSNS